MEIIIILVAILIVFYFLNITNKKEGFDIFSDLIAKIGGNRQKSFNCDNADITSCLDSNYLTHCQGECNKINKCSESADKGECNSNPYMMKLLKEGGCKEVCQQKKAAVQALANNNPIFLN